MAPRQPTSFLRINGPDGEPIATTTLKKKGEPGTDHTTRRRPHPAQRPTRVPAAVASTTTRRPERVRGHYDQEKERPVVHRDKILDKHGRPDDQFWWTDEQERRKVRRNWEGRRA
jgi:hypothetical protein